MCLSSAGACRASRFCTWADGPRGIYAHEVDEERREYAAANAAIAEAVEDDGDDDATHACDRTLCVGAARVNATPTEPVVLGGYDGRTRAFDRVPPPRPTTVRLAQDAGERAWEPRGVRSHRTGAVRSMRRLELVRGVWSNSHPSTFPWTNSPIPAGVR